MILLAGVGTFTNPKNGTTTQTITGVTDSRSGLPFTPKALIFQFTLNAATGIEGKGTWGMGFDNGVQHVGAQANYWQVFGAAELAAASGNSRSIVGACKTFGGNLVFTAYVSAIRSGEFDVTFDLNGTIDFPNGIYGTDWLCHYLALGGADLEVAIGQYQVAVSAAAQTVTGLGFRPTGLIDIKQLLQGGDPGVQTIGCNSVPSIGFAAGVSQQMGACGFGVDIANPTTQTSTYQRTNHYGVILDDISTTREFDLTSFDADGWTYTRTAATGSVIYRCYLAIGGASCGVFTSTQRTSNGTETIDTTPIVPIAALFASANHAAGTSVTNDLAFSSGFSDGSADRGVFTGMGNGLATGTLQPEASYMGNQAFTYLNLVNPGSSSTIAAQASVDSFGDTSIDLDWTTTDATAREGLVFVIGRDAAAPGAILVTKHASSEVVDPVTDNFFFTTSGLTPSSFTLTDGASRLFSDVAVSDGGGASPIYLIRETDNPRYRVTSVVVSNGSDPGIGLEVGPGETVTVDWYNSDRAIPVPIRRLRRFRLVNDEKLRMFCQRLEFDFQPGLGTTGALAASGIAEFSDPTVMLTISRDGGQTWGDEILLHIGAVGEYLTRSFVSMLGSYRNGVAEIVVTDPVLGWYLAGVYGDFEKGTR